MLVVTIVSSPLSETVEVVGVTVAKSVPWLAVLAVTITLVFAESELDFSWPTVVAGVVVDNGQ